MGRRRGGHDRLGPDGSGSGAVDLRTAVGPVPLPNPVVTASGTAGHGAELEAFFPLRRLGAVTVKSLSARAWAGNPAPRVHAVGDGMLNSVGLQGPGVAAWLADDLPALVAARARVVVSIWGRHVGDFAEAAALLAGAPEAVVALEVNLSCPNLDGGRHLFAQSERDAAAVVRAVVAETDRPVWAKLTAQVTGLAAVATAVAEAGASAVTLINTLLGMEIDPVTRRYRLGAGPAGGGYSGAPIHPVAVRAVHDVHAALPGLPIVGVGGVSTATDAVELLLAGASAVGVGTATFADPRAPLRVLDDLEHWCARNGVGAITELIGGAHE
jgi:dihydroorotate dehydrogenase (NAD+) catalytic subunit